MEAVTTYVREWRWAAMAPARSIQCMRRPPRSAFSALASLVRTISTISEIDSRTGRGRVNFALSSSFIECQFIDRPLNRPLKSLDENSALPGAICLQIAGCESEHTRVRVCVEPNLARQVESQFPMFDGSVG